MDQSIEEKRQILYRAIQELPEKEQSVIQWMIENYDFCVSICKEKALTTEQRKQLLQQATEKDDLYLLVLVLFERILNA